MTCGSCPTTARLALKKLTGVYSATVTLDDSLGVVQYDPRRVTRDLTFPAHVEAVLTYPPSGDLPVDIAGLVRARYPRPGPRDQPPPELEAVIEAAP